MRISDRRLVGSVPPASLLPIVFHGTLSVSVSFAFESSRVETNEKSERMNETQSMPDFYAIRRCRRECLAARCVRNKKFLLGGDIKYVFLKSKVLASKYNICVFACATSSLVARMHFNAGAWCWWCAVDCYQFDHFYVRKLAISIATIILIINRDLWCNVDKRQWHC